MILNNNICQLIKFLHNIIILIMIVLYIYNDNDNTWVNMSLNIYKMK